MIAVPFDHEYEPPPVAVKLIDKVAQVNTVVVGAEIPTTGKLIFCVITCDAVAVHPLDEVTVTE